MSTDSIQRDIYEATAILGPIISALLAGFAVVIFGEVHLTAAGARYLAGLERAA